MTLVRRRVLALVGALGLVLAGAAIAAVVTDEVQGRHRVAPTTTTIPPTTTTTQVLVPWTGPVEHLFFHTLVIRPDLAFQGNPNARGFRDYFVTVDEMRRILDQLDANGWTMVDIHQVVAGTVRVPPGRKPFVLSEDDVNYYDYERPHGVGWRLVLDRGDVRVEVRDERGTRVTDDDLIPMVDRFVEEHPDFSAGGAKGIIALTGYEGALGERTDELDAPDHAAALARAKAVADRLKATGWTFASHSYGHIDLSNRSAASVRQDAERWKREVEPVIGPTDVYIYPFGARPPARSTTVDQLRELGFTILCDIDVGPHLAAVDGVTVMSRRHVDGLAFAVPSRLAPFFDVATVVDAASRRLR